MRLCVFEDDGVGLLESLASTRPAFDLLCGTSSLLCKQTRAFHADQVGVLVRPPLADLCRLNHSRLHVNDLSWLRQDQTLLLNARWLPAAEPEQLAAGPLVGLIDGQIAYALVSSELLTYCSANTLHDCLETWKQTLPRVPASGRMLHYPWDLIEANPEAIARDFAERPHQLSRVSGRDGLRPVEFAVVGTRDLVSIDPSARLEPHVVFDTTRGPVLVAEQAEIQSFTRLEGPCYIGPGTVVMAAKIRASSIGPMCRVGGEIEASVIQGFSNKCHDGFLGHSFLGEWVNIGAGTQTSDLRNDYAIANVRIKGRRIVTGLTKVGSFLGDHTKTGLNTLLNTGTVVGAFCQLLPSGTYLPKTIPPFCTTKDGELAEQRDIGLLLETARKVMSRRRRDLSDAQAAVYRWLYEKRPAQLLQLQETEQRRLRRTG